jgi:hypothetical protein
MLQLAGWCGEERKQNIRSHGQGWPSRLWPFPRQVDHEGRLQTHEGSVNGRDRCESLEDREWTDSGEILEL